MTAVKSDFQTKRSPGERQPRVVLDGPVEGDNCTEMYQSTFGVWLNGLTAECEEEFGRQMTFGNPCDFRVGHKLCTFGKCETENHSTMIEECQTFGELRRKALLCAGYLGARAGRMLREKRDASNGKAGFVFNWPLRMQWLRHSELKAQNDRAAPPPSAPSEQDTLRANDTAMLLDWMGCAADLGDVTDHLREELKSLSSSIPGLDLWPIIKGIANE